MIEAVEDQTEQIIQKLRAAGLPARGATFVSGYVRVEFDSPSGVVPVTTRPCRTPGATADQIGSAFSEWASRQ